MQLDIEKQCFHCGEAAVDRFGTLQYQGKAVKFCCQGCKSIADTLLATGKDGYYQQRTAFANTPENDEQWLQWLQNDIDTSKEGQLSTDGLDLIIEGANCSACMWLVERELKSNTAIKALSANYHRRTVKLALEDQSQLGAALAPIQKLGYKARLATRQSFADVAQAHEGALLKSLGVAGLLSMQIMMLAVALYVGRAYGLTEDMARLLEWAQLSLTLPLLWFSGRAIFGSAWRVIRHGKVNMDVPVSLGLTVALLGSLAHTLTGVGESWYESIAMFILFLTATRYIESRTQSASALRLQDHLGQGREWVERVDGDNAQAVRSSELIPGDQIRVAPGAHIPVDCRVEHHAVWVDESIVSGESIPIEKPMNADIIGGSINGDQTLLATVLRNESASYLGQINRLIQNAAEARPPVAVLADKVAAIFIPTLLFIASVIGVATAFNSGLEEGLVRFVSVLIITCPCALSLAVPAALAKAQSSVMDEQILLLRQDWIERLSAIDTIAFDKTGTLSDGELSMQHTICDGEDHDFALAIAKGLEAGQTHPIAMAIRALAPDIVAETLDHVEYQVGKGITGKRGDHRYWIGKSTDDALQGDIVLHRDGQLIARFTPSENLRPSAHDAVQRLQSAGINTLVLSGDHQSRVDAAATQLNIATAFGDQSPEQKLALIREQQANGRHIAMVGDGLNDAPVLSGADAAIVMGHAPMAALNQAVAVINSGDLTKLPKLLDVTAATKRRIHQNLAWALGYNALAIPLAAVGLINPWMAAIGMSLSSLIVTLNAARRLSWKF